MALLAVVIVAGAIWLGFVGVVVVACVGIIVGAGIVVAGGRCVASIVLCDGWVYVWIVVGVVIHKLILIKLHKRIWINRMVGYDKYNFDIREVISAFG